MLLSLPRNALTVDLEDWYQGIRVDVSRWPMLEDRIEPATNRLLDLFASGGAKATFFVLGYVAEHYPALIRAIASDGHEIATHGYQHKVFWECTRAELRTDLERSIGVLEDVTQQAILGHRAPFFSITRRSWWALEILAELGVRYDSSVFPIRHWRCGVHDAPRWAYEIETASGTLTELPPSTSRCFGVNVPVAGGAYLRMWPYAATSLAIRRINEQGHPAVVYLHPWEVDPDRPQVKTDRSIAIAQRWNRDSTWPKLSRLVNEFAFSSIRDLLPNTAFASHSSEELAAASPEPESKLAVA